MSKTKQETNQETVTRLNAIPALPQQVFPQIYPPQEPLAPEVGGDFPEGYFDEVPFCG